MTIVDLTPGKICTFVDNAESGEFLGYYYPIPGTDSFAAQTPRFVHNVFPDVVAAINWLAKPVSLRKSYVNS